jgi:hypothetical protein
MYKNCPQDQRDRSVQPPRQPPTGNATTDETVTRSGNAVTPSAPDTSPQVLAGLLMFLLCLALLHGCDHHKPPVPGPDAGCRSPNIGATTVPVGVRHG